MTTVAILPDDARQNGTQYLAVAGSLQTVGRTAGEALDALNAQLDASQAGTLVIVQAFRPDEFFSEAQRDRLAALMSRWRKAREGGAALAEEDQRELEALIAAELKGTAQRAEWLASRLSP
jgi:hypothetical protein